jgi:hypothetical protein
MSRRDLIERVLAGLPASSDAVAYPDHPLLIQGPDILASSSGALTAYFVLDRHVRRLPLKMLSDVVLSRLALPRQTSFVLILGNEAGIRDEDSQIFEEVAALSADQFGGVPNGRMRESWGAEVIESLRRPHNERFGMAWASAVRRRGASRGVADYPTSLRAIEADLPYTRSRFMDFNEGRFIVSPPTAGGRVRARDLLDRATHVAVQVDYWLDLGVAGIGEVAQVMRSPNTYLALHENRLNPPTEVHRFDVLKSFRAAAFAGFSTRAEHPNVT